MFKINQTDFKNTPKVIFACNTCHDTGWVIAAAKISNAMFGFACECNRGKKISPQVARFKRSHLNHYNVDWNSQIDGFKNAMPDHQTLRADPEALKTSQNKQNKFIGDENDPF